MHVCTAIRRQKREEESEKKTIKRLVTMMRMKRKQINLKSVPLQAEGKGQRI